MLKVYGQSDDLVIIEGAKYPDDEIDCFNRDVRITFAVVDQEGDSMPGLPKADYLRR